MRRSTLCLFTLLLVLVALLGLCASGAAQQERTQRFVLSLITETTALPFEMPVMPNMPGMPAMPDLSAPHRVIEGEAYYAHRAVAPIYVTVPADLQLQLNRLALEIPQPPELQPSTPPSHGQTGQPMQMSFTSKLYWHPEVAQGPLTQSFNGQTPAIPSRLTIRGPDVSGQVWDELAKTATGSETKLPPTVIGRGAYVLNTQGTAQLDGFLPPIKVSAPKSLMSADLSQGILVQWAPVVGARGYILHALSTKHSGQSAITMTSWVSTLNEPPERVRSDYEQETTIADDLANGILLPPETTSCMVPPGIFSNDCDMFTLTVTAVGNDFYSDTDGITVRGRIRARWTSMKMAQMQGMPGMPPGGMPPPDEEGGY